MTERDANWNPMVSIVIPVYNGSNYMREAIDSAIAQTFKNIEILVINDGSNDGGETRDIAVSYGDRIRYFEKENGGVASALNLALSEMKGEYFSWLSHDDVYYPEKVADQIAFLRTINDNNIIPFCRYEFIDAVSRLINVGPENDSYPTDSLLLVLGTHINGCSLLIHRGIFNRVGLFNEGLRNTQDNELWLRMALAGHIFLMNSSVLVKSRIHAEQGSLTTTTRHAREVETFYRWAIDVIGPGQRCRYAPQLFDILIPKRQYLIAWHLLRVLARDKCISPSLLFRLFGAVSSKTKSYVLTRLAMLPGISELVISAKKIKFRNSATYWETRYRGGGTSGSGSYGKYAEYKANVLNTFVKDHSIERVAEFGCGDGNQLQYFSFSCYLGLDVSPTTIETCQVRYHNDASMHFAIYRGSIDNKVVRDFAPQLTISLDVIYHLVEDDVFREHIQNLFDLSKKFVIIYSTNFNMSYAAAHQVDRKFSDYVTQTIPGWRLIQALTNPHKGPDTQSDFYIYEKIDVDFNTKQKP